MASVATDTLFNTILRPIFLPCAMMILITALAKALEGQWSNENRCVVNLPLVLGGKGHTKQHALHPQRMLRRSGNWHQAGRGESLQRWRAEKMGDLLHTCALATDGGNEMKSTSHWRLLAATFSATISMAACCVAILKWMKVPVGTCQVDHGAAAHILFTAIARCFLRTSLSMTCPRLRFVFHCRPRE